MEAQNFDRPKDEILVVDDDLMNLRVAERILRDSYVVTSVGSGQDALVALQKTTPHLILLDVHMPHMDGFEVLRLLKENTETQDIPVVFLTADYDKESEIRGFKAGALDYITKPFVPEVMLQRVSRILELNRLQKHLQREVERQTLNAERRREQVERMSVQIMRTLARAIDAKDKYTKGHSTRVAQYAKEIARRAGLSEEKQNRVYCAGLLHDIGKIGIPDVIINKPSRLTDEEYSVIKTHPATGELILEDISEISYIAMGTRWHHERYDGKGYPDQLAEHLIPYIARIIGVADAYDAMTSKRSYRDVLSQQTVRREIEEGSGTQFDPVYAAIMLQMIDEDPEYQMREKE